MIGSAIVAGILLLVATSIPGNFQRIFGPAVLLYAALALLWPLRLALALVGIIRYRLDAFGIKGAPLRWLAPPVILVVSAPLAASGASQRIAF